MPPRSETIAITGTGWNAPMPSGGFGSFVIVGYGVPAYDVASFVDRVVGAGALERHDVVDRGDAERDRACRCVFAMPAGLSAIASPSSADATAAPARDVETAPAPGRNKPPADAATAQPSNAKRSRQPAKLHSGARTYLTALRRATSPICVNRIAIAAGVTPLIRDA